MKHRGYYATKEPEIKDKVTSTDQAKEALNCDDLISQKVFLGTQLFEE
jgi:hypothetical protein